MNLIYKFHSLNHEKRIELCRENFRDLKCANCKHFGFHTPTNTSLWCYEIENCVKMTHNTRDEDMYIPYDIKEDLVGLKNIWR